MVRKDNKLIEMPNGDVTHSEVLVSHPKEVVKNPPTKQPTSNVNPMLGNDDIDLNKLFSSEIGNQNDVLKELFTYENIKTKTDLSKNDVSIISRLEIQAIITQNIYLKSVLQEIEILRVSNNRLGRSEFVRSFGGAEQIEKGRFTEKLANIFKDKV